MGATYTRQSTYSDGDVITAAHTNDEFNQLLAAFAASTGHTHDGTTAEGGPITKLLGTAITIGDGTAGTDIAITFDGETNDGVLTWMEDEDHFKFSDDIVIDGTKRLYFNDEGGEYLHGDGTDLNIVAGADINIPANVGLTFGDDGEKIEGDGTDLTITGNNINLTATADVNIPSGVGITFATAEKIESDGTDLSITVGSGGDINIPANIGLTFGDDGEKIEGDGTDLTITGNNINLTGTADIIIPANVGLILDGSGAEKIESDGTDINFSVGSSGDINIPANIGLTFGNDGEKIEGDGTDLTITGNNINLTATADVVIPADVGLTFGSGEKIEGDDTDLTITSGAKINLTATSDIHVPNNVGIVFGGDSEKIEGDGTDMTISANNLTVDAAADITLDAGDADVVLKDDGTQYAAFTNSSGNLIIKSGSTTALTFSGANATLAGDLTISGDDLTMGTNTSGHIMVADGTNFNPVAVSGDVTMAANGAVTIANGAVETAMVNANVITGQTAETSLDTSNDVILIHDASASALRKTTLASISSALGGITDVVADTSPQLGGDLDAQGKDLEDVGLSSADSHAGIYGSSSAPVTFTVTVASMTSAHPYNGDGSSNAYFINGVEAPALTFHGVDNVTSDSGYYYKFDQADSSNSGHPLRFYLDADKTTAYTTGVTTSGTPGSSGAYTQIDVDEDTPSILYYQCSSHAYMGNHAVVLGSNKINHTEALISFPTTTGTLVGSGDTGTVTNDMLAGSIAASKLAGSIGDSKLSTISTAGKVELGALEIDGASEMGAALVDADLLIVDDGADGTEKSMLASRIPTYVFSKVSGDATASSAGALTIANDAVESGMLNDNVISGQTELASGLADTDELMVSDAGTIKRMDMSVVKTYLTSAGFSTEDPTALAIALG